MVIRLCADILRRRVRAIYDYWEIPSRIGELVSHKFGGYLIDGEGGEKAWKEGRFTLAEEDSGARTLFCELLVAAFIYQMQRRSGWS